MKRLISTLLVLALILFCFAAFAEDAEQETWSVGSTVFFGHYEQDNNTSNGDEPIEWIVLDVQGEKALLMSRYVLDCQPYHSEKVDMTWAESSLRIWLNDTFLTSAFEGNERQAILTTSVANDATHGNAEWETSGGDTTQDSIFLLSYDELAAYYEDQASRKVAGTEYARPLGAKFLGITSIGIGETDWWLRSPGKVQHDACYINVRGNFDTKQVTDSLGIRPVLWIDLTADQAEYPYSLYTAAVAYQDNAQYAEAAEIFKSLGTFNNSVAMATECRYQQAITHADAGDYGEALALFESLEGYADSYLMGRACRYQQAVAYQAAGDYDTAIRLFGEVGQYEDSMARLKECFDRRGISVYYFSAEAMNAGVDTGYSKADAINGNDKQFGWRLGRFFTSGFTRVTNDDAGDPIFIKTLGDTITLWFDLEQNIDSLNGNDKLMIAEDTNGYDQYFGVQKTNFGRGTLIIRHTDYQNAKGDPMIYTDYLLAKGTSGADTKVVLQEEGDYEVVLDYELQDNDLTHITNKYADYRIFFKFSVRNGNCMVYPFDALTGAELQNTSITENGFYLDLARSRYLDINVRRSVLIESASGVVEDERFNRPAKDGDQYTQEGIYTISVSNRYTGESTTKTIFVGSDELLQEYIANGFSMDRLK